MGKMEIEKVLKILNFEVARKEIAIAETNKIIEGKQAIVRQDNDTVLGIVSKDYRLIKHGDAMSSPALTLLKEGYDVQECYQIKNGAKAVIEMRTTDITKINGEDYKLRLFILNSYDGSTSLKMQFGLFRLTCLNGCGYIIKDSEEVRSITHIGEDKLFDKEIVLNFVKNQERYVKSYEEIIAKLGDYKVGDEEHAKKILEEMKYFGKRTVKQIIDEWKRDINYMPNLSGLMNGVTSLYSRKIEDSKKNTGNKLLHSQWQTNRTLKKMLELTVK